MIFTHWYFIANIVPIICALRVALGPLRRVSLRNMKIVLGLRGILCATCIAHIAQGGTFAQLEAQQILALGNKYHCVGEGKKSADEIYVHRISGLHP